MKSFIAHTIVLVSATAVSAQAGLLTPGDVNITYAAPSGVQSVVHTTASPGEAFSTITISAAVEFTVDLSTVGGTSEFFDNATIDFMVLVGEASNIAPSTFLANATSALFVFTDTKGTVDESDDEEILSGTFGDNGATGSVFAILSTGSITASDSFIGGDLEYTIGPALAGLLPGFTTDSSATAAWAINGISPGASLSNDGFLNSFLANGAFTGSFNIVPSPGSVALVGIGGLMVFMNRKRRS